MVITLNQEHDFWEEILVDGEVIAQGHVLYSHEIVPALVSYLEENGLLTVEVEIERKSWEDNEF